jgi:carbamoylphosphate synthase large subunit
MTAEVIEKVRPDGLFAAFGEDLRELEPGLPSSCHDCHDCHDCLGGQTALNCAVQLHRNGTLKKYGVKARKSLS